MRTREIWRGARTATSASACAAARRASRTCAPPSPGWTSAAWRREWLRELRLGALQLREAALDGRDRAARGRLRARSSPAAGMRELYEQALARRILLAPCNDAREILEHAAAARARALHDARVPGARRRDRAPGLLREGEPHRIGIRRRAPRVGEHNAEVLAGARARRAPRSRELAAEGVDRMGETASSRACAILELGAGAAGPVATRYFAEQGATRDPHRVARARPTSCARCTPAPASRTASTARRCSCC